ncbi:MAG: hypothetical protein NPINA01_33360 [Nitrospinaceae bacterium]|nr:MAG: hypothetical protein NPINA01_33360 [Nitrospinaceae bacterium]
MLFKDYGSSMYINRMTEKSQVMIPNSLWNRLGLQPGDQIEFKESKNGIRMKKKVSPANFSKYRGFLKPLKEKTSQELIQDMRGS